MALRKHHWWIKGHKGQSFAEYSIIISLISIACIGIYAQFGQHIRTDAANIGIELAGNAAGNGAGNGGSANSGQSNPADNHQSSNNPGQRDNSPGTSDANSPSNEQNNGLKDYLKDSIYQAAIGQYAGNSTWLGTGLEVAMGLAGIDIHLDAINLIHDIQHWENTPDHLLNLSLDVIAIVPVIGGFSKLFKKAKIAGVCFVPETPVLMEDGTTKTIEAIDIGEYVMSDDPDTADLKSAQGDSVFGDRTTATIPSGLSKQQIKYDNRK